MEKIVFHVQFHIKPGCAAEFNALVDEYVAATQNEAGTVSYDFYAKDDESQFISIEIYENSEAVLEHQSHNGAIRAKTGDLTTAIDLQVLGNPSEAVRKELASSNPVYFDHINGVSR